MERLKAGLPIDVPTSFSSSAALTPDSAQTNTAKDYSTSWPVVEAIGEPLLLTIQVRIML
jgi:hypothetical protein